MVYALLSTCVVGLILLAKAHFEARRALKKYLPLVDLDREISVREDQKKTHTYNIGKMEQEIERLRHTLGELSEADELFSAGFYKSKYNFNHSSDYEARLATIRDSQKLRIKNKVAIVCGAQWEVSGSKAEGKRMTDRIVRLGLSAFNVQCDNEILKVKFDNIGRAEEKLGRIREAVDKLLEPNRCTITEDFFQLKLQELQLVYEYQEKVYREKEEQRALKESMRDEEKARKELERVQVEAEREERRYQDALDKARRDLDKKKDSDREAFLLKIADLQAKLNEATMNRERAKSQAEMTRRGHVYIISNIGSFGEDVFKIGMTRRLDPMDRVWELGDASVPFDFDVHAMIHSEDAPALEKKLHALFTDKRVNRINERKEFFRVPLAEIAKACKANHGGELRLTMLAEAKEFRQSVVPADVAPNKIAA